MEKFDVIILGGGFSGLTSAIACGEKSDKKICILEKDSKLGKKILVTGNGKCNLSNINIDSKFYNTNLVQSIYDKIDRKAFNNFLDTVGIETYSDSEGRIYPLSDSAESVRIAFLTKIESLKNVSYKTNAEVLSLERKGNEFIIKISGGQELCADKCILALGGNFDNTILSKVTVKCDKAQNVLVGYKCKEYDKKLFGIRQNCSVNYKGDFFEKGQVQFKEDGVSGIVILNLSAYIQKNNLSLPLTIEIDLLPELNDEKLTEIITKRLEINNYLEKNDILNTILPHNLAFNIIKRCNLANINKDNVSALVYEIKHYCLTLLETYQNPQVYYGGISLHNCNTLQTKTCPNLFVTGEASCVFGYCGGYNIHWAISSALFVSTLI